MIFMNLPIQLFGIIFQCVMVIKGVVEKWARYFIFRSELDFFNSFQLLLFFRRKVTKRIAIAERLRPAIAGSRTALI